MTIIDILMIITCVLILLCVIVIERSDKMNKEDLLKILKVELNAYIEYLMESNKSDDIKDPTFIAVINMKSMSDVMGFYKRIEEKIKNL